MKTHFWVGIPILAVLVACNPAKTARNPYLGNVPCLEQQFAEDLQKLEDDYEKKLSSISNERVYLSVLSEAQQKEEQLKQDFNRKKEEEGQRLIGTTIPCFVVTAVNPEGNGNAVFSFAVDNETATFQATEYTTITAYGYHCDLIAQQDMAIGSRLLFDVFFVGDDSVQYGYLKQVLTLQNPLVKKGDVIPCYFSIYNIATEDPAELQRNCARVLLNFR